MRHPVSGGSCRALFRLNKAAHLASWWVSSTMTIWCSVGTSDQWQIAGGSSEIPPPATSPVPHLMNFFSPSSSDTMMVWMPSTWHARSRIASMQTQHSLSATNSHHYGLR